MRNMFLARRNGIQRIKNGEYVYSRRMILGLRTDRDWEHDEDLRETIEIEREARRLSRNS